MRRHHPQKHHFYWYSAVGIHRRGHTEPGSWTCYRGSYIQKVRDQLKAIEKNLTQTANELVECDSFFDLHVVVALKEVGNFALAELGVTKLSSGGCTAEHKFTTLSWAVRGALVSVDQLLDSIIIIHISLISSWVKFGWLLTWRQCRVLASLELTIIIEL